MGSSGAGQIQSVSFGEEAMRTAMLIAPVLFAPMAYGQQVGDQYILSEEGEIVLFALPGCEMQGKPGLYGLAKWKAKEAEVICWKYDRVIYIYAPGERTIIFDPSEVRTRDVNEAHDSVYGLAPGLDFYGGMSKPFWYCTQADSIGKRRRFNVARSQFAVAMTTSPVFVYSSRNWVRAL